MNRSRVLGAVFLAAQLAVWSKGGGGGGVVAPGVLSLKVSDEIAPAGGVVQMKFSVTEPRPIIRGKIMMDYNEDVVDSFLGISVSSPNGDASGTASWQNGKLILDLTSPKGDLGTNLDYPIVTMAVRIKPTAIPGSVTPFTMNLSESSLIDLFGQPYPAESGPGSITVGGTLSVDNIFPGGGWVNAGTPISILGRGFDGKVDVRIGTDVKYSFSVVSPTEIRVIPQARINLTGARVVVKNAKETTTYYSYLRTAAAPSIGDTVITAVKPLLPPQTLHDGTVSIPDADVLAAGFAVSNPSPAAIQVKAELYSIFGVLLASRDLDVPAWSRLSADVASAFPTVGLIPSVVRLRSIAPFEAMGLVLRTSTGTVRPLSVTIVSQ